MKKKIFLVEDHQAMSEMLYCLINSQNDMEVCGLSSTANDALIQIPENNPDLIIVDITLPDIDGIELTETLLLQKPDTSVIIYSGHIDPKYKELACKAGALGFILKGNVKTLLDGIRQVLRGKIYMNSELHQADA